jgi:hypothetical protein
VIGREFTQPRGGPRCLSRFPVVEAAGAEVGVDEGVQGQRAEAY